MKLYILLILFISPVFASQNCDLLEIVGLVSCTQGQRCYVEVNPGAISSLQYDFEKNLYLRGRDCNGQWIHGKFFVDQKKNKIVGLDYMKIIIPDINMRSSVKKLDGKKCKQ